MCELAICFPDGVTGAFTGNLQDPIGAFSAALSFKANSSCSFSFREYACAPLSELLAACAFVVVLLGGLTRDERETS